MPLSRFDRDYELGISVSSGLAVVVRPPLRISFSADKYIPGTGAGIGLNKMTIRVYNLTEAHRLALVKDAEQQKRIPITLRVGYSGALALLFKGTVFRGSNSREGPDMVTELECLDGGFDFLNSYTSRTVRSKQKAIDAVLEDMPNTGTGKITEQQPVTRPKVLVGSSAALISGLTDAGEHWYIEDEKLYIIKDSEVVSGYVPVINAASGLLDTPTREFQMVSFDTLMNPAIRIGGLCRLESTSAPHLDGIYKVFAIGYAGDNYGAKWSQSVSATLAGNYQVL